ncbi:hypothetical protein SAMN06265338_101402 [Rhodoblastus acidophilus]|uniref:Uncharacterized protein n=1 Tax=Rhodoblastus acidophilus TaxID=1074 RepID=A0A212Q5E7_RHOAC|nr:hypothetical protein [Rhodoblastus acidophilus]PPQ36353.1 hypothetical protein CKO16_18165 [Rhodoblastus acidophilus]RAI19739.1 hypothetical protein CH337_11465 [Rhodoblastus acidophilus]SNB54570.1 hypothetical protein SAMN06265338_101402 [Rhodoblastus acidophilus]
MPHFLNSVTLLSDPAEALREVFARLGFSVAPGGGVALENATLAPRGAVEAGAAREPLSLVMTARPNDETAHTPHPNGVRALAAVVRTLENPADHAETFSRAANQREMRATSAGLELKLANARLEILTSAAFDQIYGGAGDALVFATPDLAATRDFFERAQVAFEEKFGRLVVAVGATLMLAFEAQER